MIIRVKVTNFRVRIRVRVRVKVRGGYLPLKINGPALKYNSNLHFTVLSH